MSKGTGSLTSKSRLVTIGVGAVATLAILGWILKSGRASSTGAVDKTSFGYKVGDALGVLPPA